jgi:hypothetical protein
VLSEQEADLPIDKSPALLNEQEVGLPGNSTQMDRAVKIHYVNCKNMSKCPCKGLNQESMKEELRAIEVCSKENTPRIRTFLQKYNPVFKRVEPWVEIIGAIAQVNPISGQVSGLVTMTLKVNTHTPIREAITSSLDHHITDAACLDSDSFRGTKWRYRCLSTAC